MQVIPGLFTGSKALAILVMLSFLPRVFSRGLGGLFASISLRWYVFIPLWSLFGIALARYQLSAALSVGIYIQIVGLGFLVAVIPRNYFQLRYVCLSALAGAAFLGLYIAVFGMSGLTAEHVSSGRLAGGQNENQLAHALCIGLLASGVAWEGSSKKTQLVIIFLNLFTVIAIGLTRSRGSWLALLISFGMGLTLTRHIKLKHKVAFVCISIFCGLIGIVLLTKAGVGGMGHEIVERFHSITESKSSGGRLEWIWPMYLKTFYENPILGAGSGLGRMIGAASHNDYLRILAEQGIVGISLYIIMLFVFLRDALRIQYPWLKMAMVMMVFFLFFSGMTHNTVLLKSYGLAAGILGGLGNLGLCRKASLT